MKNWGWLVLIAVALWAWSRGKAQALTTIPPAGPSPTAQNLSDPSYRQQLAQRWIAFERARAYWEGNIRRTLPNWETLSFPGLEDPVRREAGAAIKYYDSTVRGYPLNQWGVRLDGLTTSAFEVLNWLRFGSIGDVTTTEPSDWEIVAPGIRLIDLFSPVPSE